MELNAIIQEAFQAAQSGEVTTLKSILHSHPHIINMENNEGLTLLGYAAHFGNKDVVRLLLDNGVEVNAMSHSKLSFIPSNTALHAAIAGERNMEVIRLLLDHRAQTNIFDSNGHTCLHTAAFHDDNVELISLLLDNGADINARNDGGDTPLSLAKNEGNDNVATFLCEQGATL